MRSWCRWRGSIECASDRAPESWPTVWTRLRARALIRPSESPVDRSEAVGPSSAAAAARGARQPTRRPARPAARPRIARADGKRFSGTGSSRLRKNAANPGGSMSSSRTVGSGTGLGQHGRRGVVRRRARKRQSAQRNDLWRASHRALAGRIQARSAVGLVLGIPRPG